MGKTYETLNIGKRQVGHHLQPGLKKLYNHSMNKLKK